MSKEKGGKAAVRRDRILHTSPLLVLHPPASSLTHSIPSSPILLFPPHSTRTSFCLFCWLTDSGKQRRTKDTSQFSHCHPSTALLRALTDIALWLFCSNPHRRNAPLHGCTTCKLNRDILNSGYNYLNYVHPTFQLTSIWNLKFRKEQNIIKYKNNYWTEYLMTSLQQTKWQQRTWW